MFMKIPLFYNKVIKGGDRMENILLIENITKYYGNKTNITRALNNISLKVERGEFVAIMGASGSGKTTLLNVISTIDKVTAGHIYIDGKDITKLKGASTTNPLTGNITNSILLTAVILILIYCSKNFIKEE